MGRKVTIKSGPRTGTTLEVDETLHPGPISGNVDEEKQLADESVASNAGKQAQSSDSVNKYQ